MGCSAATQSNNTRGLSIEKEEASKSTGRAGKDAQRTSPSMGTCSPWRLLGCFSSPTAINSQIHLITVVDTWIKNDLGGAVYHFMFNAGPREK